MITLAAMSPLGAIGCGLLTLVLIAAITWWLMGVTAGD